MYETVDEAFANIHKQFKPVNTRGVFHIYQFDIEGWGNTYLIIKDGGMQLSNGEHHCPDVIIKAKQEDYLDIVNGKVTLATAFMAGMISFVGRLDDAEKLADFFPVERKEESSAIITVE